MTLHIVHLFPRELGLFGDVGNVMALRLPGLQHQPGKRCATGLLFIGETPPPSW